MESLYIELSSVSKVPESVLIRLDKAKIHLQLRWFAILYQLGQMQKRKRPQTLTRNKDSAGILFQQRTPVFDILELFLRKHIIKIKQQNNKVYIAIIK